MPERPWSEVLRIAARTPEHWRSLEGTAYHEAGHAVTGILTGAKVRLLRLDVTVEPGGTGIATVGGRAYTASGWGGADPDLVDAAGSMAEAMVTRGDFPAWCSDSDFERIARRVRLSERAALEAPAKAIEGARAILARRWPAVKAVAEALLLRGRLEGSEVEAIISATARR